MVQPGLNIFQELERVLTELNISSPTSQEERFARKLLDERIGFEKKKLEAEAELAKEKERADRAEYNLTVANNKIGGLQSEKVSRNFHLFHQTIIISLVKFVMTS